MATPQAAPQPTAPTGPMPTPGQVINSQPFDVFSQDLNLPNLPNQVKHQPGKAAGYESRLPDVDAGMLSTLAPAQRTRIQQERESALQLDQQVHQVCPCCHSPLTCWYRAGLADRVCPYVSACLSVCLLNP